METPHEPRNVTNLGTRKERLLLVEDDPEVSGFLEPMIAHMGFEVVVALDAIEGLDLASVEDFTVVLTDVELPGPSGLALTRALKETRPGLPVVIMTGGNTGRAEARASGALGFLSKPFASAELEDALRASIEIARERDERH